MKLIARPAQESQEHLKALASVLPRLHKIALDGRQRERITRVIHGGIADNFADERAGPSYAWRQLAPATQIDRALLGYDPRHPILVRTGEYKRSWIDPQHPEHYANVELGPDYIRINEGSKDYRAPWHQDGTPNMPARRVTPMPTHRIEELNEILAFLVHRAIHGGRR